MAALEAMGHAVQMRVDRRKGDDGSSTVILRTEIRGNANAVLNAWLEAGIMHGRALLEFLGLTYDRKTELLKARDPKKKDTDWRISDFELPLVSPNDAKAIYQGTPEEAERSLVSVMIFADRSIAHMTDMLDAEKFGSHHLRIASDGIRALVVRFLYEPLGLPAPESQFSRAKIE